jgi:Zn-dependent M16 (insulinase) family peptidase
MDDMTPYLRQYLNIFNRFPLKILYLKLKLKFLKIRKILTYFFFSLLPKLGTQKKSYNEMSDLLSLNTTDLALSYLSFSDFAETSKTKQNLVLNITSLDRNIPKMFELLGELLTGFL